MTRVNLLWPRWAELVAHLPRGTYDTLSSAHSMGAAVFWKTAAFLQNGYAREERARLARIAWEKLSSPRPRELWARPRGLRDFLGLAIALAVAFSSSPASATTDDGGRLFSALGWATFAGSAGDLASTQYALSRGAVELNPLQQNPGVRIGSAVAFPLASNYLTEELLENGHPKLALWLRVAVVALKGYAIVHNLREAP